MSSNSSEYDDLITWDNMSFSSAVSTNPFEVEVRGPNVDLLGDSFSQGGAVAVTGATRTGDNNNNEWESKIDTLINSLSKLSNRDDGGQGGRDIRHIDVFNGEGSDLTVVSKLKTYLADFDDFFFDRNLNDRDKLAFAKQKLSGCAKSLVNSARPKEFVALKNLLQENFGNVHMSQDELLSELRNLKVRERESFRQFCIRATELADVISCKLECGVSDKIIFDPFSKALLSKFEPFVIVQSQVKKAVKNRLPQLLINELCELLETDNRIYLGSDKKSNKTGMKSINSIESKGTDQQACGHCFRPGHVVSTCDLLRNVNFCDGGQNQNFVNRRPT